MYVAFIFCQKISVSIFNLFHYEQVKDIGPPQVKCRLLISNIFLCNEFLSFFRNAMNYIPAFPKYVRKTLLNKC